MARTRLSDVEVQDRLKQLSSWRIADAKLHREYQFGSFVKAFGFMASAALIAESMNHHPEWRNVYGSVTVDLTTHDAGGITQNDFELATKMEEIAVALGK
jgi:4a-hydroxytetrahydrobiopterin dehydratase